MSQLKVIGTEPWKVEADFAQLETAEDFTKTKDYSRIVKVLPELVDEYVKMVVDGLKGAAKKGDLFVESILEIISEKTIVFQWGKVNEKSPASNHCQELKIVDGKIYIVIPPEHANDNLYTVTTLVEKALDVAAIEFGEMPLSLQYNTLQNEDRKNKYQEKINALLKSSESPFQLLTDFSSLYHWYQQGKIDNRTKERMGEVASDYWESLAVMIEKLVGMSPLYADVLKELVSSKSIVEDGSSVNHK
jgi:hypothetical protein